MGNINFTEDAWEDYIYWQSTDKKMLRKINSLLKTISRTPFDGEGKPEPLKGDNSGKWSRRINDKDRLVYRPVGDDIVIYQCKGHYDDNTETTNFTLID